jgi:hypothetical protein
LSLIIAVALISAMLADKSVSEYHMIFLYTLLSLWGSIVSAIITGRNNRDEEYCVDNNVNVNQSNSEGSQCVAQAVILTYTFLACNFTACMVALNLLVKMDYPPIVRNVVYISLQIAFVLLAPIVPVAYAGANDFFGFFKSQPMCFVMQYPLTPDNIHIGVVALPVLTGTALTILFVIIILAKVIALHMNGNEAVFSVPTAEVEEKESAIPSRVSFIVHLCFVLTTFGIFIPYILQQVSYYNNYLDIIIEFREWASCVFLNYDGSDSSWQDACGEHQERRPDFALTTWVILCVTGNSILSALVFIPYFLYNIYFSVDFKRDSIVSPAAAPIEVKEPVVEMAIYDPTPVNQANMAELCVVENEAYVSEL